VSARESFAHAIVRPPGRNFAQGLTTASLGVPDLDQALDQHERYCEALEARGLTLTRLPADENYPDSTFVEDTAVLTEDCAILTRPGAPSRAGEVMGSARELVKHFGHLETIRAPGTVDGGDVCEAGGHFFIGVSERTNEAGAASLARLLEGFGYTTALVDIRGVPGILHLKSGMAYVGEGRLVAIGALASREALRGFTVLPVAEEEAYAANCILVNDAVLLPAGFPQLQRTLGEAGCATVPLDMSEFQKMDGGLSCLSLRF
jgi:dimethylargininase